MAFNFYNYSAIKYNRPESLYSVGYMYEKGLGVKQNKTKAMDFYKKIS